MHTYTHAYVIHTCIYTYTHAHTQSCMHAYMYVCIYAYIHKSLIHTYIHQLPTVLSECYVSNVVLINERGEKAYVQLKHARSAFLPAETFEMWKRLYLTLYLAKPRQNAETVLQTNELFVYGDLHYVTDSVCKVC